MRLCSPSFVSLSHFRSSCSCLRHQSRLPFTLSACNKVSWNRATPRPRVPLSPVKYAGPHKSRKGITNIPQAKQKFRHKTPEQQRELDLMAEKRRAMLPPKKPKQVFPPSPTRHILNYIIQHGAQTRNTLYSLFGPSSPSDTATPTADAPAPSSSSSSPSSSSPPRSHPAVLRSKSHLTLLLRNLTRSGRILTKPQSAERKKGKTVEPFVYEARDYSRSWNKIGPEIMRMRKQRRLEEKKKRHEERQRIEAEARAKREAVIAAAKEKRALISATT